MRRVVGLIPAAGLGSRLGLPGSKEVQAVAGPDGRDGPRPAAEWLLDSMAAAGVEVVYLVIRGGKWDIPERLAARPSPRMGFIVTEPTRSIPETLDRARPFTRGADVLLGFPDVLLQPTSAAEQVLAARHRLETDIVLALFPSERPDKTDMVEMSGERVTGFRIKPGPCDLRFTWLMATWGDRFTDFLGGYLERSGGGPPAGSEIAELQISQVLGAALAQGLTIGATEIAGGRFVDIGTPGDLERAREAGAW